MKNVFCCLPVFMVLAACGSDDGPVVEPDTEEFSVSDEDQGAIADAARSGDGAEGSYDYDDGSMTLTITLESSSFDCGPVAGTITATVESLSQTTLVLRFDDDGGTVTWTRVDQEGEGLVGIWKTTDPDLYLILSSSGSAQIFGEAEPCNEDRPRNGDNCLLAEASAATIAIDGNLADWGAVGAAATVSDPAGDHSSEDDGADVIASRVAYSDGIVYVLTELSGGPSTSFQNSSPPNDGSYRLTIRGYNGLSLEATLFYSAENQMWELMSFTGGVTAAASDTGIEWAADISSYLGEGFESVDFIMVEPRGAMGSFDAVECSYFDI